MGYQNNLAKEPNTPLLLEKFCKLLLRNTTFLLMKTLYVLNSDQLLSTQLVLVISVSDLYIYVQSLLQ